MLLMLLLLQLRRKWRHITLLLLLLLLLLLYWHEVTAVEGPTVLLSVPETRGVEDERAGGDGWCCRRRQMLNGLLLHAEAEEE